MGLFGDGRAGSENPATSRRGGLPAPRPRPGGSIALLSVCSNRRPLPPSPSRRNGWDVGGVGPPRRTRLAATFAFPFTQQPTEIRRPRNPAARAGIGRATGREGGFFAAERGKGVGGAPEGGKAGSHLPRHAIRLSPGGGSSATGTLPDSPRRPSRAGERENGERPKRGGARPSENSAERPPGEAGGQSTIASAPSPSEGEGEGEARNGFDRPSGGYGPDP